MHIMDCMNDLQKYISEIQSKDFSELDIAEMLESEHDCKCSQSTINRIKSGKIKKPNWKLGSAIEKLHESVFIN